MSTPDRFWSWDHLNVCHIIIFPLKFQNKKKMLRLGDFLFIWLSIHSFVHPFISNPPDHLSAYQSPVFCAPMVPSQHLYWRESPTLSPSSVSYFWFLVKQFCSWINSTPWMLPKTYNAQGNILTNKDNNYLSVTKINTNQLIILTFQKQVCDTSKSL